MASKEPLVSITVLVDEDALPRIKSLARRLENAGLKIDDVQEATGTITGTISANKVRTLTKLEGLLRSRRDGGSRFLRQNPKCSERRRGSRWKTCRPRH